MAAAYHVIIADDDATIRSLIARIVACTYDSVMISAVPDGLDALGIYQQHGADLVITDQQLAHSKKWRFFAQEATFQKCHAQPFI